MLPGSATFPGGSRQGCVTVTPVNGDKVPMSPGFGQQPRFIVTIQPVGTKFDPPAPMTLPNVDGLKPNAVTEMYSYDHDLGMFVAIGTGTVSTDGSVIVSNPGVGVLKAGWHCGGDPNTTGSTASLTLTAQPTKASVAAGDSFSVTAQGGPPLDGTYSWSVISTQAGDDPSAFNLVTAPDCTDQPTCVAQLTGVKPGTATLRITFTCTTTGASVTTDVRLTVARQFTLNVTTFIPFNVIVGPITSRCVSLAHPLGQQLWFAGDGSNRGFGPSLPSFRTREIVTISVGGNVVALRQSGTNPQLLVGESKSYAQDAIVNPADPNTTLVSGADDGILHDCHLLDDRGTASSSGMTVQANAVDDHTVQLTMTGSVSNPLVFAAPAIDWQYSIVVDISANTYHVTGTHDGFPAHEMYINNATIFQYDPRPLGRGVGCLFPVCTENVDITGTLP